MPKKFTLPKPIPSTARQSWQPVPDLEKDTLDAISQIALSAGHVLKDKAEQVFKNLTQEERWQFSASGRFPMRLAKSLVCAVADEIEPQFSAESTLKEIKAIKRLRKARYC